MGQREEANTIEPAATGYWPRGRGWSHEKAGSRWREEVLRATPHLRWEESRDLCSSRLFVPVNF